MAAPERAGRWAVAPGEEARLTPGGATAAEVRSRGFLPLRVRTTGIEGLRPAFCGTAVVLGEATYEVVSETELSEDGLVVYRLRDWPEGEVVRDRVVYGPALVEAAQREREVARMRDRARPWRFLLYPLVGLLPEEDQQWLGDRLGLYAVTATLVSGLLESAVMVVLLALLIRGADSGAAIMMLTALPGLVLLVLPGLGRAFGAFFLRETGGSAPVVFVVRTLRAAGARREPLDRSFAPLTRKAFWERLARPDTVQAMSDGTFVFRGLLPHVSWTGYRRILVDQDYWGVEPQPPTFDRGRLVYVYRLVPLRDTPPGEPPPSPPPPTTYADEVRAEVGLEWEAFNAGFAWWTAMLPADIQGRAFDRTGGPRAARRATLATAIGGGILGLWILRFLPGPPGDPLAPYLGALSIGLLADLVLRVRAVRQGRYAPSLFRWGLPSSILRPERVAYHAHRDAEREMLLAFDAPSR